MIAAAAFALWVGNQELDQTLSAPFAWRELSSWGAYEPCYRAAERLNLERKAYDQRWYVCEPDPRNPASGG